MFYVSLFYNCSLAPLLEQCQNNSNRTVLDHFAGVQGMVNLNIGKRTTNTPYWQHLCKLRVI